MMKLRTTLMVTLAGILSSVGTLHADEALDKLIAAGPSVQLVPLATGESGSVALSVGPGLYLDSAASLASPAALAAALPKPRESGVLAFASGVDPIKGSVRLGTVLAGLDAAIGAGDLPRCRAQTMQMLALMRELGASEAMMLSCGNLLEVFKDGDLDAARKAALPVLRPFIDAFVEQEGRLAYYRMGQWAEATRLIVTASSADPAETLALVRRFDASAFFAGQEQMKELPQGALASLEKIAEIQKRPSLDAATLAELRSSLDAFVAFVL